MFWEIYERITSFVWNNFSFDDDVPVPKVSIVLLKGSTYKCNMNMNITCDIKLKFNNVRVTF